MTMLKKSLAIAVFAIAVFMSTFLIFDFEDAERKYCEAGVYDLLTPELVEMYENEIAGEKIVSDKSTSQIERTAKRLNVATDKVKAIMLLQDLAAKTGRNVSLSELADMSDIKLLGYFKQCANDYLSTLPEGRRAELEQMLKNAIKG